ncbi:MAG TPA: protein kinase [Aggregatilineales bacterium]|nr:protein kinase [Anaerolineales bacterium]HRE49291.1 protein kinase [Aggregatilineales bacterium]
MADLTGKTLGKYQIIERLGRGGMAEVYRAFQPTMNRFVAIKVMLAHLADEEGFTERFKREATMVGGLRHPNIVQVMDFDVHDEQFYMVMEYIQGESLKDRLRKRGALSLAETLDVAIKLSDALAYAHGEGMLHRDIKPANILFTKTGEPVLTDFGVAKIMGTTQMTASGAIVGTPAYMSPEAGRGEKTDERTDIYGMGIVLYEMLTGNVPFDADTPLAIIYKHIAEPIKLPPKLPDSVQAILLHALAKDPQDRYRTADELRDAMITALNTLPNDISTKPGMSTPPLRASSSTYNRPMTGQSTPAKPDSSVGRANTIQGGMTEEQPSPAPQRGRISPLLLVFVALVVVGGAVFALTRPKDNTIVVVPPTLPAGDPSQVAQTETAIPSTQSAALPTISPTGESFVTLPSSLPTIVPTAIPTEIPSVEPTIKPTDIPPTNSAATSIPPTFPPTIAPTTAATTPPTLVAIAVVFTDPAYQEFWDWTIERLRNGQYDEALTEIEEKLASDPEKYELLILKALTLVRYQDQPARLEEAKGIAERGIEAEPIRPEAYVALAEYKRGAPNYDAAAAYDLYTQAINLGLQDADVYLRQGTTARDANRPDEDVLSAFTHAIELAPWVAYYYDERANFYMRRENYQAAIDDFLKAESLNPSVYRHTDLAIAYLLFKDQQSAFDLYMRGIATLRPTCGCYYGDAAAVAFLGGQLEKAREWAETALSLDPDTNRASYVLALVAVAEGEDEKALALLDSFANGENRDYTTAFLHPRFNHEVNLDRGRILARLGRFEEAASAFERTIEAFGNWIPPHLERARALYRVGRTDDAREELRHVLEISQNDPDQRERILGLLTRLRLGQSLDEEVTPVPQPTVMIRYNTPQPTPTEVVVLPTPDATRVALNTPDERYVTIRDEFGAMMHEGNREGALRLIDSIITTDGEQYDLLAMRAYVLMEMNPDSAALNTIQGILNRLLGMNTERPEAYRLYGTYYQWFDETRDSQKAWDFYTAAIEHGSIDPATYYGRVQCCRDFYASDAQKEADLSRAIALDPNEAYWWIGRGRFYFERWDMARAAADFQKAYDLEGSIYYMNGLAASYILSDQNEAAYTIYVDVLDGGKTNDPLHYAEGAFVAYDVGQIETAQRWIGITLSLDPTLIEGQWVEALLLSQEGKYEESLTLLKALQEKRPNYNSGPFFTGYFSRFLLVDQARVLTKLNRYEEAVAAYNEFRKVYGRYVDIQIELAEVHITMGNYPAARDALLEALYANSDYDDPTERQHILDLLAKLAAQTPPPLTPTPGQ